MTTANETRPPRMPDGTRVRVKSENFDGRCDGVITAAHFDDGWLYRVDVTAGDSLDAQRNGDGELWLCDFEVRSVAIGT